MCLWRLWVEIVEHSSVSDIGSQHCAIGEIVEIQMSQDFFKTLPMTIECPNLETSLSAGLSERLFFWGHQCFTMYLLKSNLDQSLCL